MRECQVADGSARHLAEHGDELLGDLSESRVSREGGEAQVRSTPEVLTTDGAAPDGAPSKNWYAIWTRSHFEQLVSDQLASKGFEMFLPKTTAWMRRNRSRRQVQTPLFPGYVFVHHLMDKSSHVEVLKARGVVRVLGDRWDSLSPVPNDQIEGVRRVIQSGAPVLPYPYLRAGSRVRMTAGPLVGLEGVLLRGRPDRGLLVVSISLLQRAVAVEVDCTMVEVV
jgi:transcription antitermination factor NusG